MLAITPQLIFAIAAGGAIGAVLRFLVQHYSAVLLGSSFPWGTLAVNVVGCGLIGILTAYWAQSDYAISVELKVALVIGCLGAFTTFSAFSLDNLVLFQSGEMFRALLNIAATLVLCLGAVALGAYFGSYLGTD